MVATIFAFFRVRIRGRRKTRDLYSLPLAKEFAAPLAAAFAGVMIDAEAASMGGGKVADVTDRRWRTSS